MNTKIIEKIEKAFNLPDGIITSVNENGWRTRKVGSIKIDYIRHSLAIYFRTNENTQYKPLAKILGYSKHSGALRAYQIGTEMLNQQWPEFMFFYNQVMQIISGERIKAAPLPKKEHKTQSIREQYFYAEEPKEPIKRHPAVYSNKRLWESI